jgi:hypothetical protein
VGKFICPGKEFIYVLAKDKREIWALGIASGKLVHKIGLTRTPDFVVSHDAEQGKDADSRGVVIFALKKGQGKSAKILALKERKLYRSTEPAPKAAEAPKAEVPKADATKTEEPKAEGAKTEKPKAAEPKKEEPKVEEPATGEPKVEEPKAEEPKAEEPAAEEPKVEEPKAEEPATEEPKVEEPATEEPKVEEPAAEEPKET